MDRRLNALFEVILVVILLEIVSMLLYATVYLSYFKQIEIWGGDAYTIVIELAWGTIILAFLVLAKKDFSRYGLSLRNIDSDLKVVAICILPLSVLVLMNIVGLPDIGSLGVTLLTVTIAVIVLLVTLKLLTYVTYKEKKVATVTPMLIIIPAIFLSLIGGMMMTGPILILLFVEFFIFVGFGEELVFRGYMQSRLNEAFGRPYRFFGISWGAGLIIASLLFGFMHALTAHFNPFLGWYSLDWQRGFVISFGGLIFGFIREKTGNIVAPSILHGFIDFFSTIFRYV
jgi:membrane protease YdiL (CAAX protease family)